MMHSGYTTYTVVKTPMYPCEWKIEPGDNSFGNYFEYEDEAREEADARTLQSKILNLIYELDCMEFSPVGTRRVSINGLVMTNEEAYRSMKYLVNLKRENDQ